jgi:hypothetical protein
LCVYHVFSGIFKNIEKTFEDMGTLNRFSAEESGKTLLDSIQYKKSFDYFLANRQELDPFIFGKLPVPQAHSSSGI